MNLLLKFNYFLNSALNYFQNSNCPNCGSNKINMVDRKFMVTTLAECANCNLLFRQPKDKQSHNEYFYNKLYKQDGGITTDLPNDDELNILLATGFANTDKNIITITKILEAISGAVAGKSILDYGSSWGYMTWQFLEIGMKAQAYEISKPRAEFGKKKLQIPIVTDKSLIADTFDFVLSSHLIEHMDNINSFVELSFNKLKENGFLVIICPNGSKDLRDSNFTVFHHFWGQVHPNLISDEFYKKLFKEYPFYIASSPYDISGIAKWDQQSQRIQLNGGDELLCIIKKKS